MQFATPKTSDTKAKTEALIAEGGTSLRWGLGKGSEGVNCGSRKNARH